MAALLVLLAGCNAPLATAPDFGRVPQWEEGHSWTYQDANKTYRTTATVIGTDSIDGKPSYVLETKVQDRIDRYFTKSWVEMSTLAPVREESRDLGFTIEGECTAIFPLENRTLVCHFQFGDRRDNTLYNVIVGPEEVVKVPAGTFVAREISYWRTNATRPDYDFWYAPEVGNYIQQDIGDGRGLAKLTATTYD